MLFLTMLLMVIIWAVALLSSVMFESKKEGRDA